MAGVIEKLSDENTGITETPTILLSDNSTPMPSPAKDVTPSSTPINETQHELFLQSTKSTGFGVVLRTPPIASSPDTIPLGLQSTQSTEDDQVLSAPPIASSPDINPLGIQNKGILKTDDPYRQSVAFDQLVDDPAFGSKVRMLPNTGPLHPDRVKDIGFFESQSPTSQSQAEKLIAENYLNEYIRYPIDNRKEDNQRPRDPGDNLKAGSSKVLSMIAKATENAKAKRKKKFN